MTIETPSQTADEQKADSAVVDQLVSRARSLYSLPAVAAEVIQLTSNPKVDTRALKATIETDPALTAKILRVVNSSLFGLSREVSDLNQALALLGTKPLKLLVLGFSLPENLFAEVARDQLDWYWSTTLTRAVAAREISEQLFDRPGDDAFLAGLFQDIGVLVLLGELKEPYAKFLSGVIEQRVSLDRLEVDSLGFDHLQLTAALLEHWKMPAQLVESISQPRDASRLSNSNTPQAELTKVVHLAELVAELVGQNRLGVLPDLMEVGQAYCGLEKEQLNDLVGVLQPKVKQLAEVLSLEVSEETDYRDIVTAAHRQMGELAEDAVVMMDKETLQDEQAYANLLAEASELRQSVEGFLNQPPSPTAASTSAPGAVGIPQHDKLPAAAAVSESSAVNDDQGTTVDFTTQLTFAIGHCRSRRQPVSLVIVELSGATCDDAQGRGVLGQVLDAATRAVESPDKLCEVVGPCRHVLVLPSCERHEAVRIAEEAIQNIDRMTQRLESSGNVLDYVASAGVSSVALPPKNFPPQDLVDTAERCLSAAQSSGTNSVKSLEIY